MDEFVAKIRRSEGVSLPLELSRQGNLIDVVVTPRNNGVKATIGTGIANNVREVERTKAPDIFSAASDGARETNRLITFTVKGIQRLFSTEFSLDAVGGPISVIKAGSEIGDFNYAGLFGFAAVLSVNLAILNSLPIPALDGGQLVFVLLGK